MTISAAAGWNAVMHGVYRRPSGRDGSVEERIDWRIAVMSAQTIMDYPFHVGGRTALGLRGHVHYLALGAAEKNLPLRRCAPMARNPPHQWPSRPAHHATIQDGGSRDRTPGGEPDGNAILSLQNWTIRASTPEREHPRRWTNCRKTKAFTTSIRSSRV